MESGGVASIGCAIRRHGRNKDEKLGKRRGLYGGTGEGMA
jgi:hypothetical protein